MDEFSAVVLRVYSLIVPAYLLCVNLAGFIMMLSDKRRAVKDKRRIRESTLFWTAILGGSIGALAGMLCFRHKTKHKSFVIGIPAILIIQLALVIWLIITVRGA